MTNTKPTWEEEFDSEFSELNEKGAIKCKRQYTHPCIGWHSEPYLDKDEEKRINANGLKAFIQKVEQEAYERGKKEAKECQFRFCDFCLDVQNKMREQELKIKRMNQEMNID